MSLKDQLRAAILSGGAAGATPSGEAVSISCKDTIEEWGEISVFVAPANGYVMVRGRSTAAGGMATAASGSCYTGLNWVATGLDFGFYLPVKKGETVSCLGSQLTTLSVRLLKLVGGGHKALATLLAKKVMLLIGIPITQQARPAWRTFGSTPTSGRSLILGGVA